MTGNVLQAPPLLLSTISTETVPVNPVASALLAFSATISNESAAPAIFVNSFPVTGSAPVSTALKSETAAKTFNTASEAAPSSALEEVTMPELLL